jgi:DNA (cytosine-5)-methyltransferase 1
MKETPSLFEPDKPRLLDLFCGAGGASRGYHDAGFEVVGVDIKPQPRYPFQFVQADALQQLEWLILADGMDFDAVHASPPCQRYSDLAKRNGNADAHPDLIGPVRDLLEQTGLPYVIENVEGAPLRDPVRICGTTLGLGIDGYRLRRHRLFESNVSLVSPGCWCPGDPRPVIDVSGGGPTKAPRLDGAGGRTYKGTADQARAAMGIAWMTKTELNESIPPAYTRLIGARLLASVQRALVEAA